MENEDFKDQFSIQAQSYSRFRPLYPDEMFKYIASLSYSNDLAWDCATGSGQAAFGLSKYFKKVIASDASAKQIENAIPDPKILYRIFPAEKPDLRTNSVDLITVAHALHWLKIHKFYTEAKRVMKPEGIIAVLFYQLPLITEPIDKIIRKFYKKVVGKYWLPERQIIDNGYASIPFPFKKLYAPKFEMKSLWSFEDLTGYLSTWSAVQSYKNEKGKDPVSIISNDLLKQFGDINNVFEVYWPLTVWIGKNPSG